MKAIAFTRPATKALGQLPAAKLREYAETGIGDVRSLSGRNGKRLRVGDYRIILSESEAEILVLDVGHRREIYR